MRTPTDDAIFGLPRGVVVLAAARMLAGMGGSAVIIGLTRTLDVVAGPSWGANTRLGIVISLFGFLLAGAQPAVGWLANRFDRLKPLIQLGMGVFTASTLALAWATRFEHVLVLRGLQGLALAFTVPTTLTVIAHLAPRERRGTAMGVYGTARMAGFGLGPLLGALVLGAVDSVASSYLWAAVPGIVAFALVTFGLPSAATAQPALTEAARHRTEPNLPWKNFVILGGGFFTAACCISMIVALEQAFTDRLGLSTMAFSMAFSALVVGRMLCDFPMGRLSDRIGRRRLIVFGLVALGPSTLALAFAPGAASLIFIRLLMGMAMALISAPTFALVGDLVGERRGGSRVGLVTSGFGFGLAVGPLLSATLVDHVAFLAPFGLYAGLCLAMGAAVALAVDDPWADRIAREGGGLEKQHPTPHSVTGT